MIGLIRSIGQKLDIFREGLINNVQKKWKCYGRDMELWGMQIEIKYLVIAVCSGIGTGGLLFWFQHVRVVCPSKRLSILKIIFIVIFIILALYHILMVVCGQVRTGWP